MSLQSGWDNVLDAEHGIYVEKWCGYFCGNRTGKNPERIYEKDRQNRKGS